METSSRVRHDGIHWCLDVMTHAAHFQASLSAGTSDFFRMLSVSEDQITECSGQNRYAIAPENQCLRCSLVTHLGMWNSNTGVIC